MFWELSGWASGWLAGWLGARLDGILRAHMVMPNGTLRDTAVYSITATDWPAIRAGLDWTLSRPR